MRSDNRFSFGKIVTLSLSKKLLLLVSVLFAIIAHAENCPKPGDINVQLDQSSGYPYYYLVTKTGWHSTRSWKGITPPVDQMKFKSVTLANVDSSNQGIVGCVYDMGETFVMLPPSRFFVRDPNWKQNEHGKLVCDQSVEACSFQHF